ncbi:Hypothetical predicted protein [Xyrichtys novacula]|uniref:Uncharacterized protein n=1 Tax=Xyrichtys novacula TaxID=13765 RepID=A0AAV1G1M0_XYRNO|nr:Hypothetical predicted protein [Xyrichtys novacula]
MNLHAKASSDSMEPRARILCVRPWKSGAAGRPPSPPFFFSSTHSGRVAFFSAVTPKALGISSSSLPQLMGSGLVPMLRSCSRVTRSSSIAGGERVLTLPGSWLDLETEAGREK